MPFLLPSCDLLPELMKAAFMSFFTLSLHLSYFMLYIVNISRELMGQNKVLFINNVICRLKTGLEQFYKTVGLALIASLEPSARSRNIAGLSLFCKYYFGTCLFELAVLLPLPHSHERFTIYSNRLHDFTVTILKCYTDVYVNSLFPCIARPWNFLPAEFFPLTYDLNGFKSLLGTCYPWLLSNRFPTCFSFLTFSFCNLMPCCGCIVLR